VNPIGPIFLGIGALELAIGLFTFFRTRSFLERAVSAAGVVAELRESRGSEGGTVFQPVVSYQTIEGETRQFVDSVASNPPGFQVGESVPVAYDRADPGRAKIRKPFRLWFVTGLFASMGVLFLILGAVLTAVL